MSKSRDPTLCTSARTPLASAILSSSGPQWRMFSSIDRTVFAPLKPRHPSVSIDLVPAQLGQAGAGQLQLGRHWHLPANDTINESLHSAAAAAEHDASSTQTTTTTTPPLSPRHHDVTAAGAQQIIESLASIVSIYLCSIFISSLLSYSFAGWP